MKLRKSVFCMILALAVLFALPMAASAIGFNAETVYESVFVIYSGNALGSGFSIGKNCIITNAHVIEDISDVTVQTFDGDEFIARVLDMDEDKDIAVLVVEKELSYLPVADIDETSIGSDVYAIGAPQSLSYTLTKGVLSAKERAVGDYTYLQTDAAINQGNSGGPLLNDKGEVLGVNSMKLMDSEGIGLAIPITRVCEYLQSLDVPLDDHGNVSTVLDMPEAPAATDDPFQDSEIPGLPILPDDFLSVDTDVIIIVVISIFASGIVGTVLFMSLYIKERKKNKTLLAAMRNAATQPLTPQPPARDFDIEILE